MKRYFEATMSIAALILAGTNEIAAADERAESQPYDAVVQFVQGNGRVAVVIDGLPVAVYVYGGEGVTRPFFCHVRTTSGVQVTRNHPPISGHDLVDHDTMHRGIWMSFGDLNGHDYWRNKAHVKHTEFVELPRGQPHGGSFAVRNHYQNSGDPSQVASNEVARYTFMVRPNGYLILWDSRFMSDREFTFGDQEEMGLGVRMATALRVGASGIGKLPAGTGAITNAAGAQGEADVWGRVANWCSYTGALAGQSVGITIFCHPQNFRPSRFHVRGYGLLVANPFGSQAFDEDGKSVVRVRPGEELRLRFGILVHGTPQELKPDFAAAYSEYLEAAGK